jgi:hypothetical protein
VAGSRWGVQVGAFTTEAAARQAAANARRLAESGQIRVETAVVAGHTSYRAQLVGLSPAEANGTCTALGKRKLVCVLLRPESGQLARN